MKKIEWFTLTFGLGGMAVVLVTLQIFTGAFRTPRRVNWIVGLSLFLLVLAANLTGYLLPWDQLAYWATTICLGMLDYIPGIGNRLQQWVMGGPQLGPAALRNFFALHTAVLPVIIVALMTYHFWKIRKAGGLVVPKSPEAIPEEKPAMVPSNPNLLLREAAVALSAIACVLTVELNPEPLRPEKFGEKGFLRMRFPSKQGMLARVACACLLAACICILHAHDGQTAEVKKVLILFPEEGWSAPAYRTAYNAIKSAFDEADQTQITLLGESLDLYLFPSEDRGSRRPAGQPPLRQRSWRCSGTPG